MIDLLSSVPKLINDVIAHLETYLSSTRCAKIDNLDAAMSTRAPAATALSSATWTGTKAGYIDMAISGVARIKTIQYGTISVTAGSNSGDATLTTAVDTAKTILIHLGTTTSTASVALEKTMNRIFLNSTTVVRSTRESSTSVALTVGFVAVEFY